MWPQKPLIQDVYHDFVFESDTGGIIFLLLDRSNKSVACFKYGYGTGKSTNWNAAYACSVMGYHSIWFDME